MSNSILKDTVAEFVSVTGGTDSRLNDNSLTARRRAYQVLTEVELIDLIVNRNSRYNPRHNPRHNPRTMLAQEPYSSSAFILQTAAHNQLIHENIPPGSYVMIDPLAEVDDNSIMAFALPQQNTVALGIRDSSWEGYFISFGGRAVHITDKRCVPLWSGVAVVGFEL
ncbi:MAG: hypothetical protein P8Y45_00805 [Exilibacterium sp.]